MVNTPNILYKYVTLDVAKVILKDNTLRATPPNELNDPFELLPSKFIGCTIDEMKKKIMKSPEDYYNATKHTGVVKDLNEFLYKIKKDERFLRGAVSVFSDSDSMMKTFKQSINEFSEHFGILCFSDNKTNLLMWSHYAKNHTGVTIGFDSKLLSPHWIPVDYKPERFEIPFESMNKIENGIMFLARKSEDWKYENEYRTIAILESCNYIDEPSTKSGKLYLHSFNKSAIKEVIFGLNTPEKEQMILENELKPKLSDS